MKYVLLTGASSGIGEATARYLSSCGYGLVMVARNRTKLESLVSELGEQHLCIPYDLQDIDHVDTIFNLLQEKKIKLDGMAYCAGIGGSMPVRGIDIRDTENIMRVNCMAFVALAQQFLNRKYSNEGAGIVAISSLSSHTCYPGMTSYSMSKAALTSACKVLSKEVIKRKIRVNTIHPGYVRTPMSPGMEGTDQLREEQPWGYIEPEEIAYMIEFLLSDKARMITGSEIVISGGMNF